MKKKGNGDEFVPQSSIYPTAGEDVLFKPTLGSYQRPRRARCVKESKPEDKGACRDLAHWLLNFAPLGCHMPCYNKEHYNEPGNSDLHDIIWKCLKSHAKREGSEKSKLEMFYVYYATYVQMIFRYFVVMFWPGFYSIGCGMENYGVSGCVKVPVL